MFTELTRVRLPGRKPARIREPDDRLSRATTAVLRISRSYGEMHEDVRAWGAPSECTEGWNTREWDEKVEALEDLGFTPETYQDALIERTSEKWAHYNCNL